MAQNMNIPKYTIVLWVVALVLQFASFNVFSNEFAFPEVTPESQGFQSEKLQQLLHYIEGNEHNIRSIILVRNNKLAFE